MNYFSLHAEVHALIKYLRIVYKSSSLKQRSIMKNNSTIYVVRVLKDTTKLPKNQNVIFGNCMPCTNCQHYLYKFGFKRIKYTDIVDGENVLRELRLRE